MGKLKTNTLKGKLSPMSKYVKGQITFEQYNKMVGGKKKKR